MQKRKHAVHFTMRNRVPCNKQLTDLARTLPGNIVRGSMDLAALTPHCHNLGPIYVRQDSPRTRLVSDYYCGLFGNRPRYSLNSRLFAFVLDLTIFDSVVLETISIILDFNDDFLGCSCSCVYPSTFNTVSFERVCRRKRRPKNDMLYIFFFEREVIYIPHSRFAFLLIFIV